MANPTVRLRWTPSDEARLSELVSRKAAIMEANREPVLHIAIKYDGKNEEELTDFLIKNADALRDALDPFDSGVRIGDLTP